MDSVYDELSAVVSEYGPDLLTKGMPGLQANRAILSCLRDLIQTSKQNAESSSTTERALRQCLERLERDKNDEEARRRKLERKLAIADRVLGLLPTYNVGTSFLSEERVAEMMKDYHDA